MNTFLEKIRDRWEEQNALQTQPSIPLYLAGATTQISGLVAAAYQIAEPSFAYFTITLTLLGMTCAYFARRMGISSRALRGGAVVLGLVFLSALRGAGLFGAIVPPEAQGSQEIMLVSALAFTATFCSFLLVSDEAVVFTCVWAIAIIGLTGTVDVNRPLILCFVLFLVSAAFLLIHQNALGQATSGGANTPFMQSEKEGPEWSWPLLRTQIGMAAAVWATALALGFCVALPVQMVGRNLSLGNIIQRLRVPAASAAHLQGVATLSFDNLTSFNVGLGPVNDDPTERMSVLSDGPQYYRGRVFDFYTGHGWDSTLSNTRYQVLPPAPPRPGDNWSQFDVPRLSNEPVRKKTARIINRFQFINGGGFGPLYHAAEPVRVFVQLDTINARPDHTMGAGRAGGPGAGYEVVSDVSVAKASDLRNSSRSYPTDITLRYSTQGRDSDALQALSDEAVGPFTDPFGKAQAIKRFIANRCTYSREARAVPKNRDAVEFFLNDSHEGYCDLYASAMAVLCRYAGLPARVATGFAPGTPLTEPETGTDGKPEKRTRYVLRGSDMHAWAEVYFSGYGWIRFDPTEDTGSIAPPPTTPKPAPPPTGWERMLKRERLPLALVGIGVLGVLFTIGNELRGRLGKGKIRRTKQGGAATNEHAHEVSGIYGRAVRLVEKKAKTRRDQAATTGDYVRFVRDRFGETGPVQTAFAQLTLLAEQAMYGPHTVGPNEAHAARAALGALSSALRGAKGDFSRAPSG